MIQPSILNDPDFIRKLQGIRSLQFDSIIDQLIESTDDEYLRQSDQFPDPQQLQTNNIARQSIKALLMKLKTTNLELTEE